MSQPLVIRIVQEYYTKQEKLMAVPASKPSAKRQQVLAGSRRCHDLTDENNYILKEWEWDWSCLCIKNNQNVFL
jgi:hypothetical protein